MDGSTSTRSDLQVNHTGNYTCQIHGTDKARNISVIALITITFISTDGNLSANGTATLACEVRTFPARPTVMWKLNGTTVQRKDKPKNVAMDGSQCFHSVITVNTTREYICLAMIFSHDQSEQKAVIVGPSKCFPLIELVRFG
jgi:hypothetical protein